MVTDRAQAARLLADPDAEGWLTGPEPVPGRAVTLLCTGIAEPLAVLAELSPALAGVPLAGKPAAGIPAPFDWRQEYGEDVAAFLRGYILDLGSTGSLFGVLRRPVAERLLTPPHTDRPLVWALATLACLYSGDYRHAREPTPRLPVS